MKKGTKIALIIFIILFLLACLALGYGYTKYNKLDNDYKNLSIKYNDANRKLETPTEIEKPSDEASGLKEGYITFSKDYKIYAIEQHNSASYSIVVGYKNDLYHINASENGFMCIPKIADAKFDSERNYTCEGDSTSSEIHKFNGNESDLAKIVFSVWHSSTDGSKYPILIYNTGEVESTNEDTNSALKDYKIKDFISEKCNDFDGMSCKDGKASYTVILQDGSEKTINK